MKLTEPNKELAAMVKATPTGMAHWAGTGPAAACSACAFFAGAKRREAGDGYIAGEIQPGRCRKYMSLMRGALCSQRVPVHLIPPETPACSHFKQRPPRKAKSNG